MPATPMTITISKEDLATARAGGRANVEATPMLEGDEYLRVYPAYEMANLPKPKWLIRNFVEERGLTVVFGEDKLLKTAFVLSMLGAWTLGCDWYLNRSLFQMETPESGERKVLYCLLEGQGSTYDRWHELATHLGEDEKTENMMVMPDTLQLYKPGMEISRDWKTTQDTWSADAKRLWNTVDVLRPSVIVVDTLLRSAPGLDENSPHMQSIVGLLDIMRDEFGVTSVLVTHTPKSAAGEIRGHGSVSGAASTLFNVQGKKGDTPVWVRKIIHRNAPSLFFDEGDLGFTTRPGHDNPDEFYLDVPTGLEQAKGADGAKGMAFRIVQENDINRKGLVSRLQEAGVSRTHAYDVVNELFANGSLAVQGGKLVMA